MEATLPENDDASRRSNTLRWWAVGALWLALVLVMAYFSVRKSFLWAGDVNRYQQEAVEEFGLPPEDGAGDGAAAGE